MSDIRHKLAGMLRIKHETLGPKANAKLLTWWIAECLEVLLERELERIDFTHPSNQGAGPLSRDNLTTKGEPT